MLEAAATPTTGTTFDTLSAGDSVQALHDQIERMQAQIKFSQTKIEALNFEIARLKRWRFGSSAESLQATTQAVLFDAILGDTALEDEAAKTANTADATPPPAAPGLKRQAVRQALPANLPRVDRHHDISAPTAPAARPSSASAKRSASNSTACPPSSSCCATSAANMPARAARPSRPRPCPRR